jgi:glycosyltransferase involved in cell wall biosynthesis
MAENLALSTQLVKGLVSIIIPAYNVRRFIGLALDDIANQTYDHWELIVVEDGSRESCEDIIQQFRGTHPQRRVVYHYKPKNTGVSSTRNLAISLARGEFIAFFDGDDRWQPQHLQRKVQYLCDKNADLAYSRVEMFDSETDRVLCVWGARRTDLDSFPESMFRGPYLQPSGVVIRHSLARDVGPFDENLSFCEDYDFFLRALNAGKQFVFDEIVTSRYRKNHDSAATTGRLVLCYEGTARVTHRYLDCPLGDRQRKTRLIAKNYLKAGCGHMAFLPSTNNGCQPKKGPELLLQAWLLRKNRLDYLGFYLLACFANVTGFQRFFASFFNHRVNR